MIKTCDLKLTDLVARLKAAAGDNLKAAPVLYGSAVTGEFHPKHSDLNILCLVERANSDEHGDCSTQVAEWWTRQRNPAPIVFTLDELQRSADIFAIEMLDIKAHHRMLMGADFLEKS